MPVKTLNAPEARIASRPRESSRMDWLDALRGAAALVVVFEHSLDVLLPEVRRTASPWFDFGRYGVFVFFLVSGYVVPFSLERHANVRRFWVCRVFHVSGSHPGYVGVVLVAGVLGAAGLGHRYVERPAQRLGRRLTARPRSDARRPRTATTATPRP